MYSRYAKGLRLLRLRADIKGEEAGLGLLSFCIIPDRAYGPGNRRESFLLDLILDPNSKPRSATAHNYTFYFFGWDENLFADTANCMLLR